MFNSMLVASDMQKRDFSNVNVERVPNFLISEPPTVIVIQVTIYTITQMLYTPETTPQPFTSPFHATYKQLTTIPLTQNTIQLHLANSYNISYHSLPHIVNTFNLLHKSLHLTLSQHTILTLSHWTNPLKGEWWLIFSINDQKDYSLYRSKITFATTWYRELIVELYWER